jgi:hypothetical protein
MRSCGLLILAAVLLAGIPSLLWGKRMAPPTVAPVVHDGVEYRAPTGRMGCVIACDPKDGREMWWRQIYVVVKEPGLEGDVQDVFIKSMQAVDGSLQIINERGDAYKMDLKSLRVEAVKGSFVIRHGR